MFSGCGAAGRHIQAAALRLSSVALLFLIFSSAYADENTEPAVKAYCDKQSVYIGDRIKFSIEARAVKDMEVELPKPARDKIGEFEVRDVKVAVRKGFFGRRVLTARYDVAVFSAGKQIIPELEVRYRKKGSKDWLTKKTNPVKIMVESLMPRGQKADDIRDIKGPLKYFEINWIIVSIALLIIIAVAVPVTIYKAARRKAAIRLPHETALEELEAARSGLARTGDVKEYYALISGCVRHYIERVFKLRAPEMTTEEFLASLKTSASLSPEEKDLIKAFLNACDLVKFAKYMPSRTEIESVYITAKRFVEETRVE